MKRNLILAYIEDKISGAKVTPVMEFTNQVTAGIAFKNFLEEEEKKGIDRRCYNLREIAQIDPSSFKVFPSGVLLYKGENIEAQISEITQLICSDD